MCAPHFPQKVAFSGLGLPQLGQRRVATNAKGRNHPNLSMVRDAPHPAPRARLAARGADKFSVNES
jgi:hypothetical protein